MEPSYRRILQQAWPAILANAAVPLLGLADTAIVTHVGGTVDLGAVALSVLVFNFLYWALGFLRMSTTGLAAQAFGANDHEEIERIIKRAVLLAALLGVVLIACASPLTALASRLLAPASDVDALARVYIRHRIWGAPAVLCTYAVTGALIALGQMRRLLVLQVFLNAVNLVANLILVFGVGGSFAGVKGIALGTACAEWLAALLGFGLLVTGERKLQLSCHSWLLDIGKTLSLGALRSLLSVNLDILVRTFALLLGFAWFTRRGAEFGNDTLAANHLLQQFISFGAFFLDGIAFVTETFVGRAIGARDEALLRQSVKRSSTVALGLACVLALLVLCLGPTLLDALAPSPDVRRLAYAYLPLASAYVLLGVLPWQLDGIFIGAANGRALRNASVVSLGVFWGAGVFWSEWYGNLGLWCAMLLYILMRGLTLLTYWPKLVRSARPTSATPNQP